MMTQARQKCIGFKLDFVEDPGDELWVDRYSLLIDQHKMGQVVRNLISNGKGEDGREGREGSFGSSLSL